MLGLRTLGAQRGELLVLDGIHTGEDVSDVRERPRAHALRIGW